MGSNRYQSIYGLQLPNIVIAMFLLLRLHLRIVRQISQHDKYLAAVAGMSVNDTNSLTTRIIFSNNRKPQNQFNYRNMGDTLALIFLGPFTTLVTNIQYLTMLVDLYFRVTNMIMGNLFIEAKL